MSEKGAEGALWLSVAGVVFIGFGVRLLAGDGWACIAVGCLLLVPVVLYVRR